MFGFSFGEILLVATVALIVFGPEKLPEIARTVGGFASQFKKGADSFKKDFYNSVYKPLDDAHMDVQRNLKSISLPTAKDLLQESAKSLTSPAAAAVSNSNQIVTSAASSPAGSSSAASSLVKVEPVQITGVDAVGNNPPVTTPAANSTESQAVREVTPKDQPAAAPVDKVPPIE